MKRCIFQKKWLDGKTKCTRTGVVRWECPGNCKGFFPTLRYRLFKWFNK